MLATAETETETTITAYISGPRSIVFMIGPPDDVELTMSVREASDYMVSLM